MNRRTFFKTIGGLSAAIALPLDAVAAVLPKTWGISPVRWSKQYNLEMDSWHFRADVFIGKEIESFPDRITLENPHQLCVDLISYTEELPKEHKKVALEVLMNAARDKLTTLNG